MLGQRFGKGFKTASLFPPPHPPNLITTKLLPSPPLPTPQTSSPPNCFSVPPSPPPKHHHHQTASLFPPPHPPNIITTVKINFWIHFVGKTMILYNNNELKIFRISIPLTQDSWSKMLTSPVSQCL